MMMMMYDCSILIVMMMMMIVLFWSAAAAQGEGPAAEVELASLGLTEIHNCLPTLFVISFQASIKDAYG